MTIPVDHVSLAPAQKTAPTYYPGTDEYTTIEGLARFARECLLEHIATIAPNYGSDGTGEHKDLVKLFDALDCVRCILENEIPANRGELPS
jgi:hypothetical protein